MEWIVEAETLSDLIDHGRYSIASQPLIRCKDCKYYTSVTARCEVRGKQDGEVKTNERRIYSRNYC